VVEKPFGEVNKPTPRLLASGLTILLTGLAVSVGGVHTRTAIVGLAGAVLLTWLTSIGTDGATVRIPLPLFGFLAFAVVCAVQIVPIPGFLHGTLSPYLSDAVTKGSVVLLGEAHPTHGLRFLSADPANTADRAIRWLLLFTTGVAASQLVQRKRGWKLSLWSVAATTAFVLGIGTLQVIAGSEQIAFFYRPDAGISSLTTFVSTNHAATLYGIGGFAATALWLRTQSPLSAESLGSAVLAIAFFGLAIWYESYGVIIALGGSLCILLTLKADGLEFRGQSIRLGGSASRIIVLFTTLLALATLTVTLATGTFSPKLSDTSATVRAELIRSALDASVISPWVGHGAGATEYVLPPFVDWSIVPAATIPTIENEPAEWLLEFGIPTATLGVLLLASGFMIFARRIRQSSRIRYRIGFSLATFMAVISLFHFPFFALGIAAPATALLTAALATEPPRSDSESSTNLVVEVGRPHSVLLLVFVTFAGAACAISSGHLKAELPPVDSTWEDAQPQFDSLLPRRATDGDLFLRAASIKMRNGHTGSALQAVDRAYKLEPKSTTAAFRAATYARADEKESAVEMFDSIFSGRFLDVPSRIVDAYVVPSMETPQAVAASMKSASLAYWKRGHAAIQATKGPAAAVEFAIEAQGHFEGRFWPYRAIIEGYLDLEQTKLAEFWARNMLENESLSGAPAYGLLARALDAQGRRGDALRVAADGLHQSGSKTRTSRFFLSRLPPDPRGFETSLVQAVDIASSEVCSQRAKYEWAGRLCLLGRAWSDEWHDEIAPARHHYAELERRFREPGPLARFYRRHGRCRALKSLTIRWRIRLGEASEQVARLERWSDGCRQTPD